MDRAVPLSSKNDGRGAVLALGLLVLAGCAAPAPPLPPDTTSVNRMQELTLGDFSASDAAMSCDDVAAERRTNAAAMKAANDRIEGNRTQNQVAGYLGALFLVPYLATEGNYAEKDQITQLYQRHDTLIRLASVKHCPMTLSPAS
ncbi:MAG: hypothetical protein ACLQJR_04020 [Stellaceae bacterium]